MTPSLQILLTEFFAFLPKILAALMILLISLYVAWIVGRFIKGYLERQRTDPALTLLLFQITRWGIVLIGITAALRQVDFELTGLLAGLGIVGFTLGFALQDISRNIVAGMLLLVQKPFEISDLVEIEGFTGRVRSIDLRSTEIVTLDGNNVLLPNGNVFTAPIINYSREAMRRLTLTIGVAYDSDLEMVRHATLQALRTIPDILSTPAPSLYFHTFNDSAIDFTLHFWIDTRITDAFTATDPVVITIQKLFAEKNIVIPYPIQTEITVTGTLPTK